MKIIKLKVILQNKARLAINSITEYNINISYEYAYKFYKALKEKINNLSFFPQKYALIIVNNNKYHKCIFKNRYIILYKVEEDKIIVVDIIDGKSNYKLEK